MSPSGHTIPASADKTTRRTIAFLNWAHAIDHFVLLIYPTVVIGLGTVFHRSYSELIALSTAAFVAFGIFSLPAGWLADRWSRRNMMAMFYIGCGVSLAGAAAAQNLESMAVALFAVGMFASIYHPVGMAMLIEASQARGRTLAFNGVCGNLGVSLAAGVSALLATWLGWRAAFLVPAVLAVATGILYLRMMPDDGKHAKHRKTVPAVPLTPKLAVVLFGLFVVIALTAGTVFNLLTIALPKIVDERLAAHVPLLLAGGVATAVLICGGIAQLAVGRLVERFSAHGMFAAITGLGFVGNLWAAYADGIPLMIALAVAIAAIYGQITVNDIVLARYTADAWRGRVYAVRYFLLFISAATAVGMIAYLHERGGFALVLGVDAAVALAMFVATVALALMVTSVENRQAAAQAAE
ncbi:MAG TPA: MFS transporter [Pseudolabrys sp.]|jgi:MFS family permease|nr:MFS transporter [Pseudolabrys sp.]